MTRILSKVALGTALAILVSPPDTFAGRGGGYQGGRGGGGYGGGSRPGGTGGSLSFSQPHSSTNQSGSHPQNGSSSGTGYGNQNSAHPNAAPAAAGAGYANRNQSPSYSNAGAAAGGAAYANNHNQSPAYSNAGAAAAGAGYANNHNQSSAYPNAGAAAAGAGYANNNQGSAYPYAGAAAAGAGYANNNMYNQYHPGMVNGYWNGNNAGALGVMGSGSGVGAWGTGSPMYGWGYSGYSNPYSGSGAVAAQQPSDATQPTAYNSSQPISTTAPPPEQAVASQATATFDQARDAFKAGDYAKAQQLDQQALTKTPNDSNLHEFLSLALFAQGKYDEAAAPLYTALSAGPGWDWTTLSGMYPDVDTYTRQLRALEASIRANPDSAHARFVLANQYLAQGFVDNAIAELKIAVKLQPSDTLSAQLIASLQPAGGSPPPTAAAAPAVAGKLGGSWTATPAKDAKIALAIGDDGKFTWAATGPGKPPMTIEGTSTNANGILTLASKGQDGALIGKVEWQDADHFTFQLVGAPPTDAGLKFAR